jgi:outer membrane protein OmpA-like peptidoglycan-associated protein
MVMSSRLLPATILVAALLLTSPAVAFGQIGGLRDAAKRAAQREAERQVEEAVAEKMRCALGDTACIDEAKEKGQEVEVVDANGNVMSDDEVKAAQKEDGGGDEPGSGVWRNYDFVPGSDVWFALDLENEPIGRFPASQLEFVEGNGQVVEIDGERAIEFVANTRFYVNLPEDLPDAFSLELEARNGAPNMFQSIVFDPMREMDMNYRTYPKHYLSVWRGGGIAKGGEMVSNTNDKWQIATEFVPIKFQNDGNYAIMYMGEDRVANLPNADFGRSRRIEFAVQANATRPSYLRGIVIATGLDDLYGALSSGQAWTTRGILFDVDSDVLRPESTPVLNEIERTLSQHEDLSIVIEGHTDSTGDDAHNLDLSERRAAAVVAWLTGQGIDAGRLTAVGKGETEPAADNGTLEGRQANRRVVVRSAG